MSADSARDATYRSSTIADHRERVLRALVEIEKDLDRTQSLEDLAEHACLSPFHFHRVFGGLVGEGPAEYVRRLRLERAAHELATSEEPVSLIGQRAGYANPESFTRAFQSRFESSPSVFRRERSALWTKPNASENVRPARVESVPSLRVAFIRHVGPYEQATPNFERLREWAAADPSRLPTGREPLCLGIAHDMPGITAPERMRFDCCIEVSDECRAADGVGVQTTLGATFAVALHQGTFATLGDTYARLARELIPASGARIASGASVELYLTPPEQSMTQPGMTEVLLPVHLPARSRK